MLVEATLAQASMPAHSPVNATALPRICIVGPLPPPSGGMANQCEQLLRLLRADGLDVELVRTNAPYRPAWAGRIPMLRAVVRLLPYLTQLWQAIGRAQVMHLFANSGWAWHLFCAPVLWIARWRGAAVIVNYRGGAAGEFFASAPRHVLSGLHGAALRVVPSSFLQRVFGEHGLQADVIPNVIDLSRFRRVARRDFGAAPHLLVARNLEPIYGIDTALRAFAQLRQRFAQATLTVAGSGPELPRLQQQAHALDLGDAVDFCGRVDNADMPALYARADCVLNASRVDNMPISLLEALASGVPVVSTAAGGIPDMVEHGVHALLVPVGDHEALARQAERVLADRDLAEALVRCGAAEAERYAWPRVRAQWLAAYRRAAGQPHRLMEGAP